MVAPFRAQPHTVVAPQARSFDSFVRRPVAGVDGAAAPAIFDQELRRRIGIERRDVIVDVTPECGADHVGLLQRQIVGLPDIVEIKQLHHQVMDAVLARIDEGEAVMARIDMEEISLEGF